MQKADFMEPMKLIKIHGFTAEKWWPTIWSTSASGSQNGSRYAFFLDTRNKKLPLPARTAP
jgi:hypothetical protein